jgi:hypothetical protein
LCGCRAIALGGPQGARPVEKLGELVPDFPAGKGSDPLSCGDHDINTIREFVGEETKGLSRLSLRSIPRG